MARITITALSIFVTFAALAVVCLLAFFGGVIYGVQIMLSK